MDHYSFTDPEGWMAELDMLADRQRIGFGMGVWLTPALWLQLRTAVYIR